MKKLNNKGLTLVELIIAISMSTIVVGAAAMFLYNAERSYRTAEYSVDLQMEAQLLMEQMGNWVLESNYIDYSGADGSNILLLYKIPRGDHLAAADAGEVGTRKTIFLYGDKLYMIEDTEDNVGDYLAEINAGGPDLSYTSAKPADDLCIGEYVRVFDVSLPEGEDDSDGMINSIIVTMGMHEGVARQSQSYEVMNLFSMRNGNLKSED